MITGSSAIKFNELSQIKSPRLKTLLSSGSMIYDRSLLGLTTAGITTGVGTSLAPTSNGDGIFFNNQYIVFTSIPVNTPPSSSLANDAYKQIRTYNLGGSELNVTAGLTTAISGGFYLSGSTLSLYYINIAGASTNATSGGSFAIHILSTSDGLTWGGSNKLVDLTALGATTAQYRSLAVTGPTQFYSVGYKLTLYSHINSIRHNGTTWTSARIYRPFDPALSTYTNVRQNIIHARRGPDNLDYIILPFLGNEIDFKVFFQVIATDGINVFSEKPISDSSTFLTDILTSNITQSTGTSKYTFTLTASQFTPIVKDGVTRNEYMAYELVYIDTYDFRNFNAGRYKDQNVITRTAVPTLIGASSHIYVLNNIIGESNSNQSIILDNSTSVDVSQSVINYSNNSNRRIDLTLGNYSSI